MNYIPELAIVKETIEEAPGIKTIKLSFKDKKQFDFVPGQFVEVSVFGVGEAPISISSSPTEKKHFEITVKDTGNVTHSLNELTEGDIVGIRGPYGNGYSLNEFKGKNIILVSGGCGLAPFKSVIEYILAKRDDYGNIELFYGARTPINLLFKKQLKEWNKKFSVHLTVDQGDANWKGRIGSADILFDNFNKKPNTIALICGPPIMIKSVNEILRLKGFTDSEIYVSLERRMQCGVGKCCHCAIKSTFVCKEGPVFSLKEMPSE